jgi:uncharacterized membrane protein
MGKDRLTALTDGVAAVIITLMVLDLKVPDGTGWRALFALWPTVLSYGLSFVYVSIYWNNHHHLFQLVRRVTGPMLWANLHLLFWLSIIPFATAWAGRGLFQAAPTALYGLVLLASALAWMVLQAAIIRDQGRGSPLKAALGRDLKGRLSPALCLAGVALAFVQPWISDLIYSGVALMWLIPDRRIETALTSQR